ncbi:PIG-L deacetylase family protein [Nakamurella lactea]|uniref:PIG-L deacetylase family protein n=1 Tax=Nakamurella lactea TaxID=459515 RepID=UPI000418D0B2|nr:PIG-L family deacetylase [Nakamurella lactea]
MKADSVFGEIVDPDHPISVRHVLFVHAHPDDETLATGGSIARLVDDGVRVSVVTATRGERGDIVPGSLAGRGESELVTVRMGELAAALDALGVADHQWLGTPPARLADEAPRRYLDSGMQWGADGLAAPAADVPEDALTSAPLREATDDLLALIHRSRPDLLVSYEATGGYGHPDHVRVHRIARAAAAAAGLPFVQVVPPALATPADPAVDVSRQRPAVLRALRSYRTQLEQVHADHVVHVGGQRQDLLPVEYFRLDPPGS